MKVHHDVNKVTLNNVASIGEFRIRNSARAFSILSSGLYSNKIRAIIRELSCNAIDSHVAAGKQSTPFELHLPTVFEPWFSVRDYGIGLNHNAVVNIYTTYFESTKTDSNEFVGALGLGSKSPFSYTENFIVTAIKDGVKRIYSAFINDAGVPSIAKMGEEESDDGNGVEVKFSVVDHYDYHSFQTETREVMKWFKRRPTITGISNFSYLEPEYKETDIVPGVHYLDCYSNRGSMAVMGNIAYPLNNIPDRDKKIGYVSSLLDCGLVLEFGIGELDFAASREELSYIPSTIDNIRKKLEHLNSHLLIHFAKKADAFTCDWAKASFLYQEVNNRLYSSVVKQYVLDTKFALFHTDKHGCQPGFSYKKKDLESRGLHISGMNISRGSSHKIGNGSDYINGAYVECVNIPVNVNSVFVLNDLKTGCVARAKYHYLTNNNGKSFYVYCVSHDSPDLLIRQKEYDKLMKELHTPPTIIKASELIKKVSVRAESQNQGIMKLQLKKNDSYRTGESYYWAPYEGTLDNTKKYYICLNNYKSLTLDGKVLNINKIKTLIDLSGIDSISKIEILGVRKNGMKNIKKNWVYIEDKIKEEILKISDADVLSAVSSTCLDTLADRVYINKNVICNLGADSYYKSFVGKYGHISKKAANIPYLVELCSLYGKAINVANIEKTIFDAKNALVKIYPLLAYMSNNVPDKEISNYINLIDEKRKNK